jgi:hypothetical protein
MSKCQMRKYLPGGRAGGTTQFLKEDTSQTSQAFGQLMAAREAQDKMWTQPQEQQIQSNTIVVIKQQPQINKKELISIILGEDS